MKKYKFWALLLLAVAFAFLVNLTFGVEVADVLSGVGSVVLSTVLPWSPDSSGNMIDSQGRPGERAKTGSFQERTKAAEGIIPFGAPLIWGSSGDRVKLMDEADSDTKFAGIAVANVHAKGWDARRYEDTDVMILAYEGIYWVYVEEAVNEKSVVRVRIVNHASDTWKKVGNFCSTAEDGKTAVIKGISFDSSITEKGYVQVRLNEPFEIVADV